MNKINYGILIIILLICTINSNAQTNDSQPTTSITTEVSSLDSVKSILADPFPDDNLDNILSDKLDSMVNTWYVQNAYPVDSLEKACSYVEQNDIPDSVYISRLQNLDSYVPLPFNQSVKKFINFYVNKRRGQVSFMMLTDTIIVNSYVNFEQIAANLDIPVLEIRQLNPQYKRDIIPAKADKPYVLKLPLDKISPFIDNETQIFAYNRDKYFPNNQIALIKEVYGRSNYNTEGKKKIVYTVQRGDSPGKIAERFRVSTSNLVVWNNIRHSMIRTGQRLTIYVNGNTPESLAKAEHAKVQPHSENTPQQLQSKSAESALNEEYTVYTVRSGDSLYTIAKQFAGVSDLEIKLLNKIKNARSIVCLLYTSDAA